MERESAPVAGRDYPRNWREFLSWFRDEAACLSYLERLRWPDGFRCGACNTLAAPYRGSRGRLICPSCKHQASVSAGTVFEGTRTPLAIWFAAAWYMTNQKLGVSALGLKDVLGLGSYQTAWTILHKFRRAMVRKGRDRLTGNVEIDETFVGGEERGGKRGRGTTKSIIVIAVEVLEPRGFGRARMKHLPDASGDSLLPFVNDAVREGATVLTDSWKGYNGLAQRGYEHQAVNVSASGDPAHIAMPGVHRIAALLKRWLLGTHQGAPREDHLDSYLDEYIFRFNRRRSRSRGMLFYRLLQQAVATEPLPYKKIRRSGRDSS